MKTRYNRTYHGPFLSETITKDDKTLKDYSDFQNGDEIVLLEKMDGENTTMAKEYIHARSLDSNNHPSRNWVKGLWGEINYNIPEDWRVCGENMYAFHSIFYDNLESYFYCFNIWNEKKECLSFDDTIEWCKLLGIVHVPVLYRGPFDIKKVKEIYDSLDKTKQEGLVCRKTKSFHYDDFKKNVFKAVRKNHVSTNEHWMHSEIVPNKLK